MGNSNALTGSEADRVVERGKTYDHAEHGRVEVSGIWKGVQRVDSARNTDQKDVIIVRYSTGGDGEPVGEFTETVDEFLTATE